MTLPTHIIAGLLVGKLTGNIPAAIMGSVIIDLDHTLSYLKHGVLFKPKKLLSTLTATEDPWGDQRGYLHNVLLPIILLALFLFARFDTGVVLALGWLGHLVLDILDNAEYAPLHPFSRRTFFGPLPYFSLWELLLATVLLIFVAFG